MAMAVKRCLHFGGHTENGDGMLAFTIQKSTLAELELDLASS